MPLVKPHNQKKNNRPNPRSITLAVSFEVWNELIAAGSPREIVEDLLNSWLINRMQERDMYFISNDSRVVGLKMAPITEQEISIVKDQLAAARALGHNRKALMLEMRLNALEANYLAPDGSEPEVQ